MPLFKTSVISKITIFLVSAMLSVSVMALDFNQTQRLANQGKASAQYDLALMYDEGEEVRQDYFKAVEWYQKAANQGYADSQFNLAVSYRSGQGVRQDYAKAVEWYQKAANQGHIDAIHNLGFMYANGLGVRQDYAKAKAYFGKSCDNQNQDGCDGYRELNEEGY